MANSCASLVVGTQNGAGQQQRVNMNIAVSFAEFAVLRSLAQFLTPRLLGFNEAFEC